MINLSEDRILDFLDGRLATPEEEELLHTLAVSPERRQVMREHMKLREVTQTLSREERFSVPHHVTEELFSKLEEIGYSAPAITDAILAHTPEMASVAGAGTIAAGLSAGWRIGATALVTASVMSFLLGVGAYYVFGSSLGLRTRSQQLAAKHHAVTRHMASQPVTAQQFDMVAAQPIVASIPSDIAELVTNVAPANIAPTNVSSVASLPTTNGAPIAAIKDSVVDNAPPISYTAPLKSLYTANPVVPRYLPGVLAFWPSVVPSPFAKERGTISVRFTAGPGPSSTTSQLNSLTELAFQWTMWDYVIARASMGQLNSYERTAQGKLTKAKDNSSYYDITTPVGGSTSVTLIGLQAGVSLAHFGIPLEAMAGVMYSGGAKDYSQFYERGSIMLHFEPWRLLTVSAGLEGLVYRHYLENSIANEQKFYRSQYTSRTTNALTQETCGIVGPALEIGWHF